MVYLFGSKVSSSIIFFGGGVGGSGTNFVSAYLHLWWCKSKTHNKLSIWMDGLKFTVHRDGRHTAITHQCWLVESGHPMRWTGQPLTTHTGRNHCLHRTICFLRETKKSPECNSNTAFPCTVEGWPPLDSLFCQDIFPLSTKQTKTSIYCDFL